MFGANSSPYRQPGDWQVSVSSRNLVSNDHYSGTVEQHQRQELQNYVNNKQNLLDFAVSRLITPRLSCRSACRIVQLGVGPARSRRSHSRPRGSEIPQVGRGIGDISVTGRFWVFDPGTHPDWNVAAGAGLKMPTGNARYQDTFIGRVDAGRGAPLRRSVGAAGRRRVGSADGGARVLASEAGLPVWFGQLPRQPEGHQRHPVDHPGAGPPDQHGTIRRARRELGPRPVPGAARGHRPGVEGTCASLAWRIEGLKRYDLIGESHGWRRPGTSMFVEPGISYSTGSHTVSFNVPLGYYYNRHAESVHGQSRRRDVPAACFS